MKFCCFCGSKLNWSGNSDLSGYGYREDACDDHSYTDEDGVVSLYTCSNDSNCNTKFEAVILFEDNSSDSNSNTRNYKQIKCSWLD